MQKFLLRVIHVLIVASFFVPLVVLPEYFIFPFIVPKILLFRTITVLLTAAYIVMLFHGAAPYRIQRTPVTIMVLLFFASNTISTIVGVDWYRSLWDNHERMLGLFTVAHYILYYLIVTTTVKTWKEWRIFLFFFALAGSIVMLLALVQKGDPEFLLNRGAGRVSSTLGNPIYLGGYGLFLFAISLLLALREKRNWGMRMGAYAAAGFGFLGIFLSGTRGSLLGLLVGLATSGLFYAIHAWRSPQVRYATLSILFFGMTVMGVLFLFRDTAFVRHIPAVGSLLHTSLDGGTANTRLMAWGIALRAWQDRPLFGWGPNNYYYAFNQYYNPSFLRYGWGETWFDNAHNIVVNTLAVQGLFGVLVYLGIFLCALLSLIRAWKEGRAPVLLVSLSGGFLAAHLVQNIFVFDKPTSYLYFFFFLAFINSAAAREGAGKNAADLQPAPAERMPRGAAAGAGAAVLGAAALVIFSTNIQPARANTATLAAIKSVYSAREPAGLYQTAASIPSPHIDDIRNDFARAVEEMVPRYLSAKRTDEGLALFSLAYDELEKNRLLHPRDIRTHLQLAQLAQLGAEATGDKEWLGRAEAILSDALAQSPRRQQLQFLLANVKIALTKLNEAEMLLRAALENEGTVSESWWRLAAFYESTGRREDALRTIAEAEAAGVVFPEEQQAVLHRIRLGASGTAR